MLAVDVSRSIDEVEAELQRRGYVEALTNERVIDAILSGENRRIAALLHRVGGHALPDGGDRLDGDRQRRRRPPLRREARRGAAHVAELDRRRRRDGPAAQRFDNSGFVSRRRVIDISGDGRTNDGPPAEMVRDKLVAQGIVINGLPVMMNRTNFGRPPDLALDKYYEENVIGGPGSFMIVADNFDDFGRAVRTKLVREISGIDAARRMTPG